MCDDLGMENANDPEGITTPSDEVRKAAVGDFLKGLDERIGKDRPCPICGGTKWVFLPEIAGPWLFLGDALANPATAMMICETCRFIRSHLISPVFVDEKPV
jgi:hypothetical protein